MDEMISSKMHEALGVEQPAGDLRSRVIGSLPVQESPNRGFKTPSFEWAARLVAVFLAAVIVAGLLYSRNTPGPSGPYTPVKRSTQDRAFGGVFMTSPTIGWVDPGPGGHPLRTTDGGAHWTNVSPPTVLGGGTSRTHFLDGDRAWVAEASWGSHVQIVTFRTSDGGHNWQPGARITPNFRSVASVGDTAPGGLSLYFLDPEHGWLFLDAIVPAQPSVYKAHEDALYNTSDGGLHWTLLSTNAWSFTPAPFTSGCPWGVPEFISLTTGFMIAPDRTYEAGKTSNCPVPNRLSLHVTHDGGATWQFQSLPAQFGTSLAVDAPDFVDQLHGFLVLGSGLLTTSDGGNTWEARSLPADPYFKQLDGISWLDASNGWATSSSLIEPLYRTRDGGATWAPVQTDLELQTGDGWIGGLDFLDQDTGFAFRQTDTGGYTLLLKTTDGGHTWMVVGRFK